MPYHGQGQGTPCPYKDLVKFRLWLRRNDLIWVIAIFGPTDRIRRDIFTNTVQLFLMANDMFEVIALPEQCPWRTSYLINPFRARRFKGADDHAQRASDRLAKLTRRRGKACLALCLV